MKEINNAKKTLILGAIIAVILLFVILSVLESFGCFGCNMCGSGGGILRSCFDACSGCSKCICS